MIDESAFLESKALRSSVLERTDVLDRVKALSLLPDGMHVTTAMVAAYFGVTVEVIRQLAKRHREELEVNGMTVLRDADLRKFESDNVSLSLGSYPQARRSLTIYSRRAVLNVAMLLRDSEVARQVRRYLLDMELPGAYTACGKAGSHRRTVPRRPHRPAHPSSARPSSPCSTR
ncbi:hypothetical protein AB0N14_10800 [Streptomyces sp. NPDC051104]|uniref:hypothetical protein n=1 Tax=Streptomyces sp. NPDC051104 TaxID=3155044 RepID=UPI0034411BC3